VTYNNQPVVLSAVSRVSSNYPYAPRRQPSTRQCRAISRRGQTVSYGAYATLMSMRTVIEYAQTAPTIIQTWHITGVGTLGGTRPASVEVTSVLERNLGSAHSFGVFATQVTCAFHRLRRRLVERQLRLVRDDNGERRACNAAERRQGWNQR
jgi:hypothetical protein